jgi:hypothetical protein
MLIPCIIYAAVTLLLALTDTIRVKIAQGKIPNINHAVSYKLAWILGGLVIVWWWVHIRLSFNWWTVLAIALVSIAFVGIRVALYDLLLNLFRIWTGTNPTGKIDYVSTETSSYEDQHSEKVGFWAKRAMGVAGFVVMFLLYKVIFKV